LANSFRLEYSDSKMERHTRPNLVSHTIAPPDRNSTNPSYERRLSMSEVAQSASV
jgi:hypothetical protein